MRIFVAGATGTLGRPLVHRLVGRGHVVVGLTRFESNRRALESSGARAAIGNALDRVAVVRHVAEARPEVVVQLLTALPPSGAPRRKDLERTNRVRTTGNAHLIEAAVAAGSRRLVAESFVGIYGAARFASPANEDVPLPEAGRTAFAGAALALREMERQLASAADGLETVALRIGLLYGPGVPSTERWIADARRGRLLAPSGLGGVAPFVHIDDAADALVAAIEHPAASRVYNIVDDEAVDMSSMLERLSVAIGARPPRHVPGWLIRLLMPVLAELGSAELRLSNEKAAREFGWRPRHPTVESGLATLARAASRPTPGLRERQETA